VPADRGGAGGRDESMVGFSSVRLRLRLACPVLPVCDREDTAWSAIRGSTTS
jgi:hypothetical protein